MLSLRWFTSLNTVTGTLVAIAVEPASQVRRIVCNIDLVRPTGQHMRAFSQVVDVVDTKKWKPDIFFRVVL